MVSKFREIVKELYLRLNPGYMWYRFRRENAEIDQFVSDRISQRPFPAFSIVVPTYGIDLYYVKEFVGSLRKQTYTGWELCVCDDGDPSPGVADYFKKLEAREPGRFRFVQHQKNQGIIAATQTALKLARREFVVLADADDLLHARALEVMAYAIAEENDVDFLYSNHDYMTDWGLRLHPMIKPGWSPELLMHVNYINHLKVFRTTLLREIIECSFAPEFNGAQDWSLCFQVLQHARKVRHVPFVLYHWRTRPGSMANDVFSKPWAVAAQLQVRTKFFKELNNQIEFNSLHNQVAFTTPPSISRIDLSDSKLNRTSGAAGFLRALLNKTEGLNTEYIYFDLDSQFAEEAAVKAAAYCALPRVGGVWPFNSRQSRIAFTPIPGENGDCVFLPILHHRGSYSNFSGNVLAGPLPGMTMKRSQFIEAAKSALSEYAEIETDGRLEDVCGILLSLASLKLGFRNASVDTASFDYKPEPVRLPLSPAGLIDPYI